MKVSLRQQADIQLSLVKGSSRLIADIPQSRAPTTGNWVERMP